MRMLKKIISRSTTSGIGLVRGRNGVMRVVSSKTRNGALVQFHPGRQIITSLSRFVDIPR